MRKYMALLHLTLTNGLNVYLSLCNVAIWKNIKRYTQVVGNDPENSLNNNRHTNVTNNGLFGNEDIF